MALDLYEVHWSHFCEKARWCLDFKRLPYRRVPVNPYTRKEARAIAGHGEVPILKDGDVVLPGSAAIAAHLEATHPEPPLLPRDPEGQALVLAIQKRCDEELGPDARRLAYQEALRLPVLLEGTILWSRPPWRWLNGPWLRLVEPRLRAKFAIHPAEIERSRVRLRALLTELQSHLAGRTHLVGDTLTLADITVVSLMDPLEIVPEFVREKAFAPIFAWRRRLAGDHQRPRRVPWLEGSRPSADPIVDSPRALPEAGTARDPRSAS
jgi:glutathione S-transferase